MRELSAYLVSTGSKFNPHSPCGKQGVGCMPVACDPRAGEAVTGRSLEVTSVSLASLVSSRSARDPVSKKEKKHIELEN